MSPSRHLFLIIVCPVGRAGSLSREQSCEGREFIFIVSLGFPSDFRLDVRLDQADQSAERSWYAEMRIAHQGRIPVSYVNVTLNTPDMVVIKDDVAVFTSPYFVALTLEGECEC